MTDAKADTHTDTPTHTHTTAIMGGKKGGCASGGLVREIVAIWQPVQ